MKNKLVSILIPTYNRADFLDYSLKIHIPLVKKYNIQICIFDNSSTDRTKEVVCKWMHIYPHLIYHQHETNIGGISNFEYALKYPQTDYVWLLGDTYQIQDGAIDYIIKIIKNSPQKIDAIVLNLQKKIDIPTCHYNNSNTLLNELGALMTCIAVSIFRKDMIKDDILRRYRSLWFTHTAIIFEDISNRDFLIHWAQEYSILSLEHPILQKTNWSHTRKAFEIGCEDWTNFVMSLPPSYTINNKMKCIMDFGKVSGLFTLKNLLLLRFQNILTYRLFKKYYPLFKLTIDFPLAVIFILSITPKIFLQIARMIVVLLFANDKKRKIKLFLSKESLQ